MTSDEVYKLIEANGLTLHGDIEHFAALVASAERERLTDAAMKAAEKAVDVAIALEREACAQVCETLGVHPALNVWNGGSDWYKHGKDCATAIRARGQA